MFDKLANGIDGHIRIRDPQTNEVFVDKANAIHFGNMSWAIAHALAGQPIGVITYMVFGSGGSSIDSSGNLIYRTPNTSTLQDATAAPYQPVFWKSLNISEETSIDPIPGNANFADLRTRVLLGFGEPDGQEATDSTPITNAQEQFVFDEIALYTGDIEEYTGAGTPFQADGRMVSHVIFHPTQKANNRQLEIEYTIRIQMGP